MPNQDSSFTCPNCDRHYRFKPELAGKQVRCKCGEKFEVKPTQARPDAARPRPMPKPAPSPAPQEDDDIFAGHLPSFDEATRSEAPAPPIAASTATSSRRCPACNAKVSEGAAICINCGADLRSGKKIRTQQMPAVAVEKTAGESIDNHPVLLKITAVGLGLHGLGAVLLFLGMTGATAGGGLAQADQPIGEVIATIGGILLLIGMVPFLLGPLMCLAAPGNAGRSLAVAAIGSILAGIGLIAGIEADILPIWLSLFQQIPFLVGIGCFLGFVHYLTIHIDNDPLYERSQFLLKCLFAVVGLRFLVLVPCLGCLAVIPFIIACAIFGGAYGIIVSQVAIATFRAS